MVNHSATDTRDYSILYFRRGVPEAFKLLFFEHYPELFSFSLMLLQTRTTAQKVTIAAFFQLWDKRNMFESDKNIKAFLYLVIRNKCLETLRSVPSVSSTDSQADIEAIPASLPADVLRDVFDYAACAY